MDKTKEELLKELEKIEKRKEEQEKRLKELEKRKEEQEKRKEELEERRHLEPDMEKMRMKFETFRIGNERSSIKSAPTTSVPKLHEICAEYESLLTEYIVMDTIREFQMGLKRKFAKEVRYQEIYAELAKLEPDYQGAKHHLALPSTIARNIKLRWKFKEEEILRIPARLFGTLFKDESVQPESAIDGMIMRRADGMKYQSMSFIEETIMNEGVMSLLELTGFDFQHEYHLDKGKGRMDGFCHLEKEPVAIFEGKLPDGNGHPLMHGFVCYKRANAEYVDYLAQFNKKPRQECFPCLIITNNGVVFNVYGALTLQTEERKERR